MVQNSREQRGSESQKVIFFEGLSGRVREEKEKGTRGERKNAGVSNLFISLKKVTVVYQLTIHSHCCTSPDSLSSASYSVFQSISLPLPLSVLSEAALPIYCNSPSCFLSFPHFPFSSPCISFLNQIYMGFCRPSSFTLFQIFSHVFFCHCHSILS